MGTVVYVNFRKDPVNMKSELWCGCAVLALVLSVHATFLFWVTSGQWWVPVVCVSLSLPMFLSSIMKKYRYCLSHDNHLSFSKGMHGTIGNLRMK